MNQALLAGSDFHKCAEVHDTRYLAEIHSARLGIGGNRLHNINRALALFGVQTGNKYLSDFAVLFDVNLDLALCLNLLDNLAALADNLADFVGRNGGGVHLGSIG